MKHCSITAHCHKTLLNNEACINMYRNILKISLVSFLSILLSACGDSDADNYEKNKAGLIEALKDPDVAKAVYEASLSARSADENVDEMENEKRQEYNKNKLSMLSKYGTMAAASMIYALKGADELLKKNNDISVENGLSNEDRLSSEDFERAYEIVREELLKEDKEKGGLRRDEILKMYDSSNFVSDSFRKKMLDAGRSDNEISVAAMTAMYIIETGETSMDGVKRETINNLIDKGHYDLALSIVNVYGRASFFYNKYFSLDPERAMKISGWLNKKYSTACFESYEGCAIMANAIGDQHLKKSNYSEAYFFYALAATKAKLVEGLEDNDYGEKVFLMLDHLGCTQDRDVWGDFVSYSDGEVMIRGEKFFHGVPYPRVKYANNINIYSERISLSRKNNIPNLSKECVKNISI